MTNAINLADLPTPDIIQALDFETTLAANKAELIALMPADQQATIQATLALESEPLTKFIEFVSWKEMLLTAAYNDEARALLLASAKGSDLDHIGYTYYRKETRLEITPADPNAIPPVEQVLESDEDFRNRLALKPESYSVAGPRDAYIFHALSASGLVKDASCISPEEGTSLVTILATDNNGVPSQSLLDTVTEALSVNTVRPLCEQVLVQAPEIITYLLTVDLYTYEGPDVDVVIEAARQGLQQYVDNQFRLGVDHTQSGWLSALHVSGVQRVELNLGGDLEIDDTQAARCTSFTINHAGVAK